MGKLIFVLILGCSQSFAALTATMIWRVQGTSAGADTNGYCFDAATAGTDYTDPANYTGAAAAFSDTNLVIDAVTNTKVTSATHNFVAADVGNCINISAGTGYTTGIYRIVSVASNAATLDRSPGAVGITGGTWAEGGSALTLGAVYSGACGSGCVIASNRVFIKYNATAYVPTATITWSVGTTPLGTAGFTMLIGYNSTLGDACSGGPCPTLAPTGANYTLLNPTGVGQAIENLILDVSAMTVSSTCFASSQNYTRLYNVKCTGFLATGIAVTGTSGAQIDKVEVTGGQSGCTRGINSPAIISRVYVHDSLCEGINLLINGVLYDSVIEGITGAAENCVTAAVGTTILHNVIDTCGQHGIGAAGTGIGSYLWRQNVISNMTASTSRGINFTTSATAAPAHESYDGNCFYNNVNGGTNHDRNKGDLATGQAAYGAYTNVNDKYGSGSGQSGTVTADVYVATGTDWRLNTTAAGGAQCRLTTIDVVKGLSQIGYASMGAYQIQPVPSVGGIVQ